MNIFPISVCLMSILRRISRRVRRYINRKLIPDRKKVMAVQTFRFLCRIFNVGIVWYLVSKVLLHLSISHVIHLQFEHILALSYAEFPDDSGGIERRHTMDGRRVSLDQLRPDLRVILLFCACFLDIGIEPESIINTNHGRHQQPQQSQ